MNNQYKYVGKPFTAAIAEDLILELCEGETLKKVKIRNRVYKHQKDTESSLESVQHIITKGMIVYAL